MTVKLSKTRFDTALAGLGNYNSQNFFFSVNSHSLSVSTASRWSSSWPMSNTDSISGVSVNYAGLEGVWRPVSGTMQINVPYSGTQYSVEAVTYYQSGQFKIDVYVVNQTGGTITIPQFFVNVHLALFNAPF